MIDLFKILFFNKNDKFLSAKNSLKKIKEKFDGFVIDFPDITPNEIMFITEKWETLPKNISNGVKIMAIKVVKKSKIFLTSYKPNSYIKPHKHNNEYESGLIIKGTLVDVFSDKRYEVGDIYEYNPNETHYLSSLSEGCLVYSVLSEDSKVGAHPITNKLKKIISYL